MLPGVGLSWRMAGVCARLSFGSPMPALVCPRVQLKCIWILLQSSTYFIMRSALDTRLCLEVPQSDNSASRLSAV